MQNLITLKLNKEFKRAYFQGRYKAHPLLVTYQVKNRTGGMRYGITASKKIGCAVMRNRARRLIRQAYASLLKEGAFPSGFDYVFVARPGTPSVKMDEVKEVMQKQIRALKK